MNALLLNLEVLSNVDRSYRHYVSLSRIDMSAFSKDLEILKIVIDDERHYRTMVQSRISYHTSIVLALIAVTGALAIRAQSFEGFLLIAFFGLLIRYVASQTVRSVERLYQHFIEAIRAREEIEIALGIRNPNKERRSISDPPICLTKSERTDESSLKYPELFCGSWIPTSTSGYLARTQEMFTLFSRIGSAACGLALIISVSMVYQALVV